MTLPTIPELRRPVLEAHADGDGLRLDAIAGRLAGVFDVSDDERSQKHPSGDRIFDARIGWARQQLIDAGWLERPELGLTRITAAGSKMLASGDPLPPVRTDWAAKLISHASVLAAIEEFETNGRDETLKRHGYRRALDYVVVHDGNEYDSKALYAVAYGIEYPDDEPLRGRGIQGGRTIVKRLEDLGFEVRSQKSGSGADSDHGSTPRVWLIRAGSNGQYEEIALGQNVCVLGWRDLGPVSPEMSRDDLKARMKAVYTASNDPSIAAQAGQVYRFVNDVSTGDLVVLPRKSHPDHVAVGRVLGEYVHRTDGAFADSDAQHTRNVDWLVEDLPYSRFDVDLRQAFGQQGTLSEISRPAAYQRILDVLSGADAGAVHLVVKWSESDRPTTVSDHREVVDADGAVWWGPIGSAAQPQVPEKWFDAIRKQLADGVQSRVFVSGLSCWQTTLLQITDSHDDVDPGLVPAYYPDDLEHGLWVKLTDFEEIDRSWLTEHLELTSTPGVGLTDGALQNETNPLIVRQASQPRARTRRTWWVCQGSGYDSSSDLGVLWAPMTASDGSGRAFWRALTDARLGDLVINYAESHVRGVSTVTATAIEAPKPSGMSGDSVGGDGWLVGADFHALEEPIALSEIPTQWRVAERGPFTQNGSVQQGYFFPLSDRFVNQLATRFPQLGLTARGKTPDEPSAATSYAEPGFDEIEAAIGARGLRIVVRDLRRYHVSLKTRGFVVLAGVSGGGKTWLAEAYADIVGAERLVVPVAPNWTTNEDVLGYRNPLDGKYRHTEFSLFLTRAAAEYADAGAASREPRPFHLILDEMNLARVEYYFAKFLSAMEARARYGTAPIVLADDLEVQLTPNLKFIGTVNVDETTFGFADKVYDRAQLIELRAPREALSEHMSGKPYRETILSIWDAVHRIAPFAFRVLDEIDAYVTQSEILGVSWEEALDDQLLQKVLPKVKGMDPGIRDALDQFVSLTDGTFLLSHEKAEMMLDAFNRHGFTSYF